MSHLRTFLAVCVLALPIPAAVAGCGGGDDSSEDPQQVLDETFNNDKQISSGVVDVTATVSAGDQGSFDFELQGPFQSDPGNAGALPQLDWTANASGEGAGQSVNFDGELVVTQDNAYVVYGGSTYEVGSDIFNRFKQAAEQAASQSGAKGSGSFTENCQAAVEQAGGDTSVCDVDFESWLTNVSNDGTTDVDGTSTIHVSGDADVQQIAEDLVAIGQQTGGTAGQTVPQAQLDQLEQAVSDAHVDVYSGEDDHLLRKLDFTLSIDPSAFAGATPVPIDSVDVDFGVTLSDVNSSQSISAPSGPTKPIGDLLNGLGGLGLGGLGGASLGSSGSSGSSSASGANQKYLDCISKATSAADVNKCAALLE